MLKSATFFLLGLVAGGVTAWQLLSSRGQYEAGHRDGEIMAKLAFAEAIKTLGTDYQRADGLDTVFSVKDVQAVTVQRNGIKTSRLYNPSAR